MRFRLLVIHASKATSTLFRNLYTYESFKGNFLNNGCNKGALARVIHLTTTHANTVDILPIDVVRVEMSIF